MMSNRNSNGSTTVALAFGAGTIVGIVATAATCSGAIRRRQHQDQDADATTMDINQNLPQFALKLDENPNLHRIRLREWEDCEWRSQNGWKGRDLCHNPHGKAVRVLNYYYDSSNTKEMIGVVWFGPHAESHRGLCHGGAMSSLMDDFCGHMAFIDSEKPWSGATVQVNVALKKPVPVGSILRIIGKVTSKKGRKVHVEATLDDGDSDDGKTVYATLEGLSIDGVKMSAQDDDVAERIWEDDKCKTTGRLQRRDSGWNHE